MKQRIGRIKKNRAMTVMTVVASVMTMSTIVLMLAIAAETRDDMRQMQVMPDLTLTNGGELTENPGGELPDYTEGGPAPAVPQRGQPVAGRTEARLTQQQVRERTQQYIAVNLWVENTMITARDNPGNFHQVMLSEPTLECVLAHEQRLENDPTPSIEELKQCAMDRSRNDGSPAWQTLDQNERAARTKRAAALLFWALDPPSLISVRLANERGIDVGNRTDPNFAQFASRYDGCEENMKVHAERMADGTTSTQLAQLWLEAEDETRACINLVNQEAFGTPEQAAVGPGPETETETNEQNAGNPAEPEPESE